LSTGQLKYGAAIHRVGKDGEYFSTEGHFHTANERFIRFPITINMEDIFSAPKTVRTRGDLKKYYKSKIFTNQLIRLFCKYGVRNRPWKCDQCGTINPTSLKAKKFEDDININTKFYNRGVQQYFDNYNRHKQNQENIPSRTRVEENICANINNNYVPFKLAFNMDKRIFHIAYKRDKDGNTLYGAAIYNLPDGKNKGPEYNELHHFYTANQRLERYPISIYLKNTNKYNTRHSSSGEIKYWNDNLVLKFRKMIAKYGVRFRQDTDNSHRFVTKHQLDYQFAQNNKLFNKTAQKLNYELAQWQKVRTI